MILSLIDKNNYIVKIPKKPLDNINIYNKSDIELFMKKIFKKLLNKYKLRGLINVYIYTDNNYGMIIKIINNDIVFYNNEIDVKITFYINNSFLYKIDYLDYLSLNINNETLYYYNNNFYLEIKKDLNPTTYFKLLEFSEIIFNDTLEITDNSIKVPFLL